MNFTLAGGDNRRSADIYRKHSSDEADSEYAIRNARLAMSRGMPFILQNKRHGSCSVPKDSVYGAAMAVPQFARSAGWPWNLTVLAIRGQILLILNLIVQLSLLYQINLESNVMNLYGGQMHLCSYGHHFDQCPGPSNCIGPGGTTYKKDSLYANFQQWSVRMYTRDSLIAILPDRADEIREKVLPGEYGIESVVCRVVCVILFVMAIIDELRETGNLASLLCHVPTVAEPWLFYEPPKWMDKERTKSLLGQSELDFVKFRINGMPLYWKLHSFFIIIIPKFIIWILLATEGTQFLMETAGIQDLIINSLSMGLVLQMDELIMSRLCSHMTIVMMEKLESFKLFDCDKEDGWTDDVSMERYEESLSRQWSCRLSLLLAAIPGQLMCALAVAAVSFLGYYRRFCIQTEDGSYISKPLYPPTDVPRSPLHLWFLKWLIAPSTVDRVDAPTWSMPQKFD